MQKGGTVMKSSFSKSLSLLVLLAIGFLAVTIEELQQCSKVGGDGESCYELDRAYLEDHRPAPEEKSRFYIRFVCDSGVAHASEKREGETLGTTSRERLYLPPSSIFVATQDIPPCMPSSSSVESSAVPSIVGKLTGDFDGDGKQETIGWTPFASKTEGTYYQLLLFDDDGCIVWKGPRIPSDQNPLVALSLDTGIAIPELAADIDGDGKDELLIPQPQSDVSPQYYRRLRWDGRTLKPMAAAVLMMKESRSSCFTWVRNVVKGRTWVASLGRDVSGSILAEITRLSPDGSRAEKGRAFLRLVPGGAVVARWDETLRSPITSTPAPMEREWIASQSGMGWWSGSYVARLSDADHYNSQGVRLRRMIDILRQDRANYHRLGIGDQEDDNDPWFADFRARKQMSRMRIVPIGIGYRSLRRTILFGTPLVEVTPRGDTLMVRLLDH